MKTALKTTWTAARRWALHFQMRSLEIQIDGMTECLDCVGDPLLVGRIQIARSVARRELAKDGMTTVIHPCPFCGYTDTVFDEPLPDMCFVYCPECEAKGPLWTTVDGAIYLWNERTPHAWHDMEGPL
jgi:Lar family restriction alleviation protein